MFNGLLFWFGLVRFITALLCALNYLNVDVMKSV